MKNYKKLKIISLAVSSARRFRGVLYPFNRNVSRVINFILKNPGILRILRVKALNTKGISLVEMLIATSLFAIAAVVSSSLMIDIIDLEKKSSIQNVFYEDTRILLQQLSNEIQQGTIDYEEYYNMSVIGSKYYGTNYGVYASRFYDPGFALSGNPTSNPTDLGVECSYPSPPPARIEDCEIVYTLSTDLNTGQNPFACPTCDKTKANAFCDHGTGNCSGQKITELYLIDSTGTKKTIISRKKTKEHKDTDDYSIGLLRMHGLDIDQNGVIDTFTCDEEYICVGDAIEFADAIKWDYMDRSKISEYGITLPSKADSEMAYDKLTSAFIPISPMKSSILDLEFIIHPLEDPYRAFAENEVQTHPSVTVILTMGLSKETQDNYPGEFTPITLQTTVSAGVVGRLNSYPPTNDLSWISKLGIPETGK